MPSRAAQAGPLLDSVARQCRSHRWQTDAEEQQAAKSPVYGLGIPNTREYPHRRLWRIETDKQRAAGELLTLLLARTGPGEATAAGR